MAVGSRLLRGAWGLIVATLPFLSSPAYAQYSAAGFGGASALISSSGAWSVQIPAHQWTFSGTVGRVPGSAISISGEDKLGTYSQLTFRYETPAGGRTSSIRVYLHRPVVIFSAINPEESPNLAPFPVIKAYPMLRHLSFLGMFAQEDFANMAPDGVTSWFDAAGHSFVISAASNFMTAETRRNASDAIVGGISAKIEVLPAGFRHETILTWGEGINQTLAAWGRALTDLSGKVRPASDADLLLEKLSYWTDNGATYYYNSGSLTYPETLQAIKTELQVKGIRLGSLQLDSWWYPKGPDNHWFSREGIWTYSAATHLFRSELAAFNKEVGTPLITHARWIDKASPYRSKFLMSGNVSVDPRYWDTVAAYLKAAGVKTYEQDWLGLGAHTDFNLKDPDAFLDNMALSMAKKGLTVQYCMANPSHFLQSTKYSNVTNIRTSQDRFGRERWSHFLYSSRLAAVLGTWPFSDVFMSSELDNLLLATLSSGPVGIGDAMGAIHAENLRRAVRADGVIVKPDTGAAPIDSVILADAEGRDVPMQAAAYTDFGGKRNGVSANYIVAYPRGKNTILRVEPRAYGIAGPAYLYDVLRKEGRLIEANSTWTTDLGADPGADLGYYVLVPVGRSGMALLGDRDQFVTLGRKRIADATDDGVVDVTVNFSVGEGMRTLTGFSPSRINVSAVTGRFSSPVWSSSTAMFTFNVRPEPGTSQARFRLSQPGHLNAPPRGGACAPRCAAPPGNGPVQ